MVRCFARRVAPYCIACALGAWTPAAAQEEPLGARDAGGTGEEAIDLQFVLQAFPVTTFLAPDFEVEITDGMETVEVEGPLGSLPNLKLGLGIETPFAYFDVLAGGGVLLNTDLEDYVFVAPMLRGDVAARFKIGDRVTLGPHVGVAYFPEPEWFVDELDAEFSDSLGLVAGISLSVGVEAISFSLSVDYIGVEFDLDPRDGAVADRSRFDLSGVAFQFGIISRF